MRSSPFDCALFGKGLLKLDDEMKGGWGREKDRDREIYIFVFQMKEKVYLDSLNNFCEVREAG